MVKTTSELACRRAGGIDGASGPDGATFDLAGRKAEIVRRQPDGSWLFVIDNP